MCTKWFSDGDVHKYFNPYGSPYDAYINYMNIVSDFISRIDNILSQQNNIVINDTKKDIEPQKTKTTKQSKQTSVKKSNKKAQKINNIKLTKNQIEKLIKEFNTRELAILSKQLTKDSFDKIVNQLDKKQKEKLEKELQKTLRPRQDTIDKIMNKFNEIIG
jgi:Mg/Co/Ni transporter MgtE